MNKIKFTALIVAALLLCNQAQAALPYIFQNLNGNVPAADLDADYNAVAFMGATQCSATGTNTIALTQSANQTDVIAYQNYQSFSFKAAATSTGAVTVNVNSIGALPVYLPDGTTQAASGDIITGVRYTIAYNSALNGGSGGFQIISGQRASFARLTEVTTSTVTRDNDAAVNQISYALAPADFLIFNQTSTSGHDAGTSMEVRRVANYTGAPSASWVNNGILEFTTVNSGANGNEWGITGEVHSSGSGSNVGIYGQGWRQAGSGPMWGMVAEAQDFTGAESAGALLGIEVDAFANGVNNNHNRIGVNVVAGRNSTNTNNAEIWAGLYLSATETAGSATAYYTNGLFVGNDESIGLARVTATNGVAILADGTYGFWDRGSKTSGLTLAGTYSGAAIVMDNTAGHLPVVTGKDSIEIAGGTGESPAVRQYSFASSNNIIFNRAEGTPASPSRVGADSGIGNISAFGYGTTGYSAAARAQIKLAAAENWTDTAQGAYETFSTTPAGGTATAEVLRLDSKANVLLSYNGTTGVISTSATDRMPAMPTFAGAKTGTPTAYTGMAYFGYDTTNDNFTVWNPVGAAWHVFGPGGNIGAATGTSLALTGKIGKYNNINTAGQGVASVYSEAIESTQTANSTILTYAPPATAGRYRYSCAVTTTSATNTGTVQITIDYTDSQGTAHAGSIIRLAKSDGTTAATQTGASSEFSCNSGEFTINSAAANIVMKVVVTGTVSYTGTATIEQLG